MSRARVIITAVVVEGRSQAEVAREYGVSPGWVSKLVARYRAEGDAAFEPRSRRPHSQPAAASVSTVDLIVGLRRELAAQGLDAGADTIVWHLEHHHQVDVSRATIYRVLRRQGLIEPAPKKKPKSSYIRFQADQPNETWQADFTHHRLADGADIEILTWLDDHSRFALSVTAHRRVTGPIVVATFRNCITTHGTPFSTLTDNGLVFTTRFSNRGKTSRNGLENELAKLGVLQKNSRPNHPTTCGKVERFQQTMKKWLRTKSCSSIIELQTQIDAFVDNYNHRRPHRSLAHRSTPAATYLARRKAGPAESDRIDSEFRVRHDRINAGRVSLRVNGQMHHIGLSRTLDGTRVITLINGYDIRVIHAITGEIIRTLTIDPERRYHGTGKPGGHPKGPRKPKRPEPQ